MASYEINEEGVEALNGLNTTLQSEIETIIQEAEHLKSAADSNSDVLGPHISDIEEIIETINTATRDASDSVEELTAKVDQLIAKYEEIIAHNISV